MNRPIMFPNWILECVEEHQSKINPRSLSFFKKLVELIPDFDTAFLSIPSTVEVGELTSFDPNEIKKRLGQSSPLEFILLNTVEWMHFQFVYQLRELSLSFLAALQEGKFFVAAILSRSILEVVCVNYYSFRRVDEKISEGVNYLEVAARTKSPEERSILLRKYYEATSYAFSHSFRANHASSFDPNNKSFQSWQEYMSKIFGAKPQQGESVNKISTLTAIDDVQKKSKLPLMPAYDIFSEFVHPNIGSKMLVINSRRRHHPIMDAVRLGDNGKNSEAVLFYFDHLSEGSYYSWTLALSLFHRQQKTIAMLDRMCSYQTRTDH